MNRFKKTKKKLSNKRWVERKLRHLAEQSEDNHTFYQFKCNWFFVGCTSAELNLDIYRSREHRINRHIKFLKEVQRRNGWI